MIPKYQTNPETGNMFSRWLVMITAIFVTCLITANITAVKLISIGGLILPSAVIIFPVSYIVGDVLTEVYGYQSCKAGHMAGFLCNLLAVSAIWISGLLPSVLSGTARQAYEKILGIHTENSFASVIAYLMGEFSNSFVLAKME